MTEEFLTQEEVDLLLKGMSVENEAKPSKEDTSRIRPYNLATQERIVRGRMPTLEIIHERFDGLFKTEMFNALRRNVEVSRGSINIIKFGDFVRNLVVPTNLNLVQMKPLFGNALVVLDPRFIDMVVDVLFGGDGRSHVRAEGRGFTDTEQRIIQHILTIFFDTYSRAWAPVYPIEFGHLRSEMHAQFMNIATPKEVVIASSFTVEIGGLSGQMHICIPYAMVEPIRELLCSSIQGENMGGDNRWMNQMSKQIQSAELEIVADLGTVNLKMRDVMNLKVGDVVPFSIPGAVTAKVDAIPVIECTFGVFNGRRALRVEKLLSGNGSVPAKIL
ncbi:MAG: flagellar motor switch protein FliM [Proteobacteria bacterium]|nr:flagellar motor switch protein FliM [Pseudomonadota bacterium]